jgi:hypothetical protein
LEKGVWNKVGSLEKVGVWKKVDKKEALKTPGPGGGQPL